MPGVCTRPNRVIRYLTRLIPLLCPSRRASEVSSSFAIRRSTHQSRRQIRPESISPISLDRSEEHTSELQSLMRISYAVFCLTKKKHTYKKTNKTNKHEYIK